MVRQISAFVVVLAFTASAGAGFAQAQDQTPAPRPVRVGGVIKAPVKIKDVPPVYPPEAMKQGIQGVVILELLINETGAVQEATVLRGVPQLDEAAIEAVLQWVYMPTLLNGQPVPVFYNITVAFSLRPPNAAAVTAPVATAAADAGANTQPSAAGSVDAQASSVASYDSAVRVGGTVKAPTRLVSVPPVFSPDLQLQGGGVVILELLVAPQGYVQDVKVLRSVPHLDQAAIDAVRQWVYAPTIIDGVPRAVIYNITVAFAQPVAR